MRQPRLRTVLIATGAALALVAGSTTAYAAVAGNPVDSSGVIHGCWTKAAVNGSHVFVLQDAGTSCPTGTIAISWNQQGPAGPAGATGPQGPVGNTGPAGATGQQGPPGNTGPAGATGPAGPAGTAGPAGPAGANGNTVLHGTGTPANSVGNNGDFYIDTAADVLYGPKAGGAWPTPGTSLVGNTGPQGPQGLPGLQGLTGPAGVAGANGTNGNTVLNGTGAPATNVGNDGDFYLDTAADVLYGPKAGGSWPAVGTSLVGPAGPAGAAGAGATVTPLSSGDSHCGNGGAAITDGNGNTAYACTGATGPAGPAGVGTAGPSGLDLITVAATAALVVNPGVATEAFAAIQCPSSHPYVVSGGGYFDDVGTDGPFLIADAPIGSSDNPGGQTGWAVQGFGGPPVEGITSSDELHVYATCSV